MGPALPRRELPKPERAASHSGPQRALDKALEKRWSKNESSFTSLQGLQPQIEDRASIDSGGLGENRGELFDLESPPVLSRPGNQMAQGVPQPVSASGLLPDAVVDRSSHEPSAGKNRSARTAGLRGPCR